MRGLNFCIKPCTRRIQCTILVSTTTLHRYKGRITSNLKQYCHQKSQEYMRTSLKLEKENSLNIFTTCFCKWSEVFLSLFEILEQKYARGTWEL